MSITKQEIANLRLRNQRVTGEKVGSAAAAVAWLGCVQAQVYPLAKWSLGKRVNALRDTDVDAALTRAEILRTHILRPTWHFVAPADIRWIMRLTGPRILAGSGPRIRYLRLDDRQIGKAHEVIARALEGGRQLTRLELQAQLARAGLEPDGQRIAYIVIAAECSLLVVSGAPRGREQTYALLDEWVPRTPADSAFDREQALVELARRYFTSHGPATVADFVWWSGLTTADTRAALALNAGRLEEIHAEETTYWWAGDAGGSADAPSSPSVHLMQAYDEYVVGYASPRTEINLAGHAPRGVLRRPPFDNEMILDTQVCGYWRRLTTKAGFMIQLRLLHELDGPGEAALGAEIERYATFVDAPVELKLIG